MNRIDTEKNKQGYCEAPMSRTCCNCVYVKSNISFDEGEFVRVYFCNMGKFKVAAGSTCQFFESGHSNNNCTAIHTECV